MTLNSSTKKIEFMDLEINKHISTRENTADRIRTKKNRTFKAKENFLSKNQVIIKALKITLCYLMNLPENLRQIQQVNLDRNNTDKIRAPGIQATEVFAPAGDETINEIESSCD